MTVHLHHSFVPSTPLQGLGKEQLPAAPVLRAELCCVVVHAVHLSSCQQPCGTQLFTLPLFSVRLLP